jgi:hypothetical protein
MFCNLLHFPSKIGISEVDAPGFRMNLSKNWKGRLLAFEREISLGWGPRSVVRRFRIG